MYWIKISYLPPVVCTQGENCIYFYGFIDFYICYGDQGERAHRGAAELIDGMSALTKKSICVMDTCQWISD